MAHNDYCEALTPEANTLAVLQESYIIKTLRTWRTGWQWTCIKPKYSIVVTMRWKRSKR